VAAEAGVAALAAVDEDAAAAADAGKDVGASSGSASNCSARENKGNGMSSSCDCCHATMACSSLHSAACPVATTLLRSRSRTATGNKCAAEAPVLNPAEKPRLPAWVTVGGIGRLCSSICRSRWRSNANSSFTAEFSAWSNNTWLCKARCEAREEGLSGAGGGLTASASDEGDNRPLAPPSAAASVSRWNVRRGLSAATEEGARVEECERAEGNATALVFIVAAAACATAFVVLPAAAACWLFPPLVVWRDDDVSDADTPPPEAEEEAAAAGDGATAAAAAAPAFHASAALCS
jgi:hypothetical protein